MHQTLGKAILIKWEQIVSSLLQYCFFPETFPKLSFSQECFREFYKTCFLLLGASVWVCLKNGRPPWRVFSGLFLTEEMDHVFQRGLHCHMAPTRESHEPGKSDLRKLNVGRVFRQNKSQVIPRAFFFLNSPWIIYFFYAVYFLASSFLWRLLQPLDQSEFAVFLCFAVSAPHTWQACVSFLLLRPTVSFLCRVQEQALRR